MQIMKTSVTLSLRLLCFKDALKVICDANKDLSGLELQLRFLMKRSLSPAHPALIYMVIHRYNTST